MSSPTPVYLDCDTGIDDTVALAYLLRSPAIDLVGVGTVSGNIDSAQAARNTLDLLTLGGHPGVPVAVGAHDHLSHPYGGGATHVHGANGVGGIELPGATTQPDARDAAQLLIDLSHEYEGTLHVLAIGPLTNLAQALERDETLAGRIDRVTIMGGAALAPGNASPVGEANIWNDPEAAAATLAAAWDTTLVPLDVTMQHLLHEDDRQRLLSSDDPFAVAVGEILDHYFDFYLPQFGERLSPLHDPLAAMVAAAAPGVGRAVKVPIVVDATDGPGRGQTIADLRGQRRGPRDHDGVRTAILLDAGDPALASHLMETLLRGA